MGHTNARPIIHAIDGSLRFVFSHYFLSKLSLSLGFFLFWSFFVFSLFFTFFLKLLLLVSSHSTSSRERGSGMEDGGLGWMAYFWFNRQWKL